MQLLGNNKFVKNGKHRKDTEAGLTLASFFYISERREHKLEDDKLKIKSSFLKGIISSFIKKKLKKKFGDKIVDITINDIDVTLYKNWSNPARENDGLLSIHVDVSASAKREIISDIMNLC